MFCAANADGRVLSGSDGEFRSLEAEVDCQMLIARERARGSYNLHDDYQDGEESEDDDDERVQTSSKLDGTSWSKRRSDSPLPMRCVMMQNTVPLKAATAKSGMRMRVRMMLMDNGRQ
jgi:hypothetical protein